MDASKLIVSEAEVACDIEQLRRAVVASLSCTIFILMGGEDFKDGPEISITVNGERLTAAVDDIVTYIGSIQHVVLRSGRYYYVASGHALTMRQRVYAIPGDIYHDEVDDFSLIGVLTD